MKYIWMGPPTAVEVYGNGPEPIFSGPVRTGGEIDADLSEDIPQVAGWLAFGLIAPVPPAKTTPKAKEPVNG